MTDDEITNLTPNDDQDSALPEWVELTHAEGENEKPTQNIDSEDPDQTLSKESETGWQKESLEELDDGFYASQHPNNDKIDSTTFKDPAAKADATIPVLPRWLENVVEAEELKDTSKLTLQKAKSANAVPNSAPGTTDKSTKTADTLLSSISNSDLLDPDTQPTFIQVISSPQSDSPNSSLVQIFPELVQLLKEKRIVQAYKHGQELISKDESLPLLLAYLIDCLQQYPDVAEIWHLLGDGYMRNNQPTKAIQAFTEASRLLSK